MRFNLRGIGFGVLFFVAAAIVLPAQTFTTLALFDSTDGANRLNGLVQGTDGNFYGTTYNGGANGLGTVYKITPSGTITTIHSFCNCGDDEYPYSALVLGTDGNFYGAAENSVFKVTPSGTLTLLHAFSGTDGSLPWPTLALASDGSFIENGFKDKAAGVILPPSVLCVFLSSSSG